MKVDHVPLDQVLTQRTERVEVHPEAEYPIAGVLGFGRGLLLRPTIRGTETQYKYLYQVSENDVVYSKVKAFEGAFAVVGTDGEGRYVSPEFPVFTVRPSADPAFVRHFLASDRFMAQVRSQSSGIGARRERVSPGKFLQMKISLPSVVYQRRIAAHLDAIARTASLRLTGLGQTERRLNAIARAPLPGTVLPLADLVQPVSRPRPVHADRTYEMAGVRWYGGGLFMRERLPGSALGAKTVYDVHPEDLVYNRLFAWKESFALATTGGLTVSNEFPTFEVRKSIVLPEVLLALLLAPAFTAQVNDASTGSTPTSRNRLKEEAFLRLSVTVPPMKDQPALARVLGHIGEARGLAQRSRPVAEALLPAARNEVFSQLQ